MKAIILVPTTDLVPIQFAASLVMLRKPEESIFATEVGSLIYHARNKLANDAIRTQSDIALWFDSDMTFPTDTFDRLYQHIQNGADIVTGLYTRRVPPYSPTLFKTLDKDENGNMVFSEFSHDEIPEKPFPVAACGFGAVMMKTDVLFDMSCTISANLEKGDRSLGTSLFEPIGTTGEDCAFCWRARKMGYEIICDPSIPLGHVGHTVFTRQFWNLSKGKQKQNV